MFSRYIDRLVVWWIERRWKGTYGTWVYIKDGYTWSLIEKKATPGTCDPLGCLHTVGIKVSPRKA